MDQNFKMFTDALTASSEEERLHWVIQVGGSSWQTAVKSVQVFMVAAPHLLTLWISTIKHGVEVFGSYVNLVIPWTVVKQNYINSSILSVHIAFGHSSRVKAFMTIKNLSQFICFLPQTIEYLSSSLSKIKKKQTNKTWIVYKQLIHLNQTCIPMLNSQNQ